MSTIRCPECRLINVEAARRCRRCSAPLSPGTERNCLSSKFLSLNRAARYLVIPLIAIVSVACIYGFYRHSREVSTPRAGITATGKGIGKSAPANQELEEVKKLNKEFIARLDQNMADREGKGPDKNQTLAFETLTLLQQQDKFTDPAAQKYLNEFYRLVEKYYSQLIRYNSESGYPQEVRQRIRRARFRIVENPSLSADDKASGQVDLWNENASEVRWTTVTAGDIDETVKALRNLSSAGTDT